MGYPAKYRVYSLSTPADVCEKHAQELAVLAGFMGWLLSKEEAPNNVECQNCINEVQND